MTETRRQLEAYISEHAFDTSRIDPDQEPVAVVETPDRFLASELEGAGFDVTLCVHVHGFDADIDYTRYLDDETLEAIDG